MNIDDKIVLRFQKCHTRSSFHEGRLQRVSRSDFRRGFPLKDCGNDTVTANSDINVFGGIILISLGFIFLIFSKQIAHKTNLFYQKLLCAHFSENGYQIAFFIAGTIFIVFGVLSLFGIIKFK